MTKGVFLISDALLDVDHFFLGQRAARHGDQGDDPAQHRQTVLDGKGHPEDAAGVGIRGLGHGGGVTQKGDRTGGDDSSHRGDELIDQAVSAGDNRRDVTAAAVQLVVDGISHVRVVGGGDAHVGAVLQQGQQDVNDHVPAADHTDLTSVGKDEEQDQHRGDGHADAGPGHDALLAAFFAYILCTEGRKEDGRHHADHAKGGSKTHVADEDAVQHRVDDGLAAYLLCQLIGSVGGNIALQGLVVFEHLKNIRNLQRFVIFADALKVFGLIVGGDAGADDQGADAGNDQDDGADRAEEALIEGAAALGQDDGVDQHAHAHGHEVVQRSGPDTDGGTLAGIVGHNSRQGLDGHVADGIADDVNNVGQNEHRQAEALAGTQVEHTQQAHRFDQVAADQQNAQLAETGVDAVVDECQHRIGEGVQNAGQHQDDANGCSGDAVADAGRITCHTDQGVDAHAHKGVAGVADDLPCFGAAVLDVVYLTGTGFLLEHNVFPPFCVN